MLKVGVNKAPIPCITGTKPPAILNTTLVIPYPIALTKLNYEENIV